MLLLTPRRHRILAPAQPTGRALSGAGAACHRPPVTEPNRLLRRSLGASPRSDRATRVKLSARTWVSAVSARDQRTGPDGHEGGLRREAPLIQAVETKMSCGPSNSSSREPPDCISYIGDPKDLPFFKKNTIEQNPNRALVRGFREPPHSSAPQPCETATTSTEQKMGMPRLYPRSFERSAGHPRLVSRVSRAKPSPARNPRQHSPLH